MEIDAVKTSYARWAPVYDRTFGKITQAGRRRSAAHINTRSGSLLELGVGTGLSLPLFHRDLNVTGIDFSEEMLAKARRRVAHDRLTHVEALRQMDARALDFPDASFDTVAAMHVLSVVPEPERVMAEIARVLAPGGQLVVTNHFKATGGALAGIERVIAPLADTIGWHSDFEIATVLAQPDLVEVKRERLPPAGIMTFLVLEKRAAARTKPQIRDATQSDADAIRACAEAAHAHHVEIIGRRPAPMDMDVAAAIRAARTRVVEGPGGTLAGYAVARVNDDHMELESVAVRPEAAGRGVGGALIRDCEAEAWRRGLPAVRLYTNAAMTENLRLYPHLGYRETDRRHEDGFDRVYYEKARPSALNG